MSIIQKGLAPPPVSSFLERELPMGELGSLELAMKFRNTVEVGARVYGLSPKQMKALQLAVADRMVWLCDRVAAYEIGTDCSNVPNWVTREGMRSLYLSSEVVGRLVPRFDRKEGLEPMPFTALVEHGQTRRFVNNDWIVWFERSRAVDDTVPPHALESCLHRIMDRLFPTPESRQNVTGRINRHACVDARTGRALFPLEVIIEFEVKGVVN